MFNQGSKMMVETLEPQYNEGSNQGSKMSIKAENVTSRK